jgi:phosphomannomutase
MAGQILDSPLMISVSGVRGIVGRSLTADTVLRWAQSFGANAAPGPVVVGGDSRVSKTMMRAAVIAGLADSGCRVIDVGVVPTPTIGLSVRYHQARGGIAITASHNPAEWNALKFYGSDSLFLDEASGARLRERVESAQVFHVEAAEIGSYEKDEQAIARHLAAVLNIPFLKRDAMRAHRFRVGLDAVHGAGGELLKRLLEDLGCEVIGFHLEPTGRFPRNPEPLPAHLQEVCKVMHAAQVDIGFVVDPDADRLAVILENGRPAGEELTLCAAADLVLQFSPGAVVANCSTTMALEDVAARYNSQVIRTKVGEAHVARKILESGAVIGGEGNGGVMLPQIHAARDSAVGIALILQALLDSKTIASQYFASLPHYHMVKRRVDVPGLAELSRMLHGIEALAGFGSADRLDGLKWVFPKAWVQIRASNTEPIIRVYAEAKTPDQAQSLAADLVQKLNSLL